LRTAYASFGRALAFVADARLRGFAAALGVDFAGGFEDVRERVGGIAAAFVKEWPIVARAARLPRGGFEGRRSRCGDIPVR
jgi:hypothetical protein